MALFWAAPAGALLVGYLALPDYVVSAQCEGSLFGCAITPQDGMVLLAVFVYPLVLTAGLLVMGVIALWRAWCHRPWAGRCHADLKMHPRRCSTRKPCKSGGCVATALQP
jgi:hypothetical protein